MALNVDDRIARLDPARRRKVEERAAELIAEEMTLRELRKARQLTQARVATELGHHPGRRLAARATQRSAAFDVAQDGGGHGGRSLSLIARFPDRPPVELSGTAEQEPRD